MKILSVVGARPQFVKLAPVHRELLERGLQHIILHTGQHYDPKMSRDLFIDLGIPKPDFNLNVGSGTHASQTGLMLQGIEPLLLQERPDWVLVYGDTNSTIAAALAASKLHVRVAHLEAGLRSFNMGMPEEINRRATDHISDLLLAPTETAMSHLEIEGLAEKSVLTGDVMADVCLSVRQKVESRPPELDFDVDAEPFILATIHRAENTDDPARLDQILRWLAAFPIRVVLLAHPRILNKCKQFGVEVERSGLLVQEPLTYQQMVYAVTKSEMIVTDSGGLQKEAFILKTPTVTIRAETEWPETLENGWNILAPDMYFNVEQLLKRKLQPVTSHPFGVGKASQLVAQQLISSI